MALNTKYKKTSLDENAQIYAKRDEEESEKSKWSRMDRRQKIIHFKTYYLRPLIIVCVVLAIAGYFIYADVIMKKAVVYQCAILNEKTTEMPMDAFSEKFTEYLGLDTTKNQTSFHLYYTNNELAGEVGASATTDLTQVSSMIYAATLDSMIAGQEDFDNYLENTFFVDLTEILNEEELRIIQDRLYIPATAQNEEGHPYGVFLNDNEVYRQIYLEGGKGIVEKPILGILFNSENKEYSRQFLYYLFPELKSATP